VKSLSPGGDWRREATGSPENLSGRSGDRIWLISYFLKYRNPPTRLQEPGCGARLCGQVGANLKRKHLAGRALPSQVEASKNER
jgi:hypothetical protein